MLLPILEQVAIIPVKANTFGDHFSCIHEIMYIPNIYYLSTEKIKQPCGSGILKKISINYFCLKHAFSSRLTICGIYAYPRSSEKSPSPKCTFQPEIVGPHAISSSKRSGRQPDSTWTGNKLSSLSMFQPAQCKIEQRRNGLDDIHRALSYGIPSPARLLSYRPS